MTRRFFQKLRLTLDMIKFEHSVFALPFALTGAALAVHSGEAQAAAILDRLPWIVVAMVAARSAAMTFNRIVDASIDARNPRTCARHIPAGLLSRAYACGFLAASCGVFLFAAWRLNPLCLRLAPLALAIVFFYSFTKRFTSFSHLVLGFCLGIAPAAAWIAMTGSLDVRILWLTAAVSLWTAGFDIIYSCQDIGFDRETGLFSLPSRIGAARALIVARFFHATMVACLAALGWVFQLGWLSAAGVALIAALLIYEHSLVKPNDFSRVNAAFFTVNGYVSVLFFLFWATDILIAAKGKSL